MPTERSASDICEVVRHSSASYIGRSALYRRRFDPRGKGRYPMAMSYYLTDSGTAITIHRMNIEFRYDTS